MYGAVNKPYLSTGETRELVPDNVGFGLNPEVERAPPRRLLSNWRDRPACKNLRNVATTGTGAPLRGCQDNGRLNLGRGWFGSPAWIRTTIHGSKGRCPTIRRPGKTRDPSSVTVATRGRNADTPKPLGALPFPCGARPARAFSAPMPASPAVSQAGVFLHL